MRVLEIATARSFLAIDLEVFEPRFLLGDDFVAKVISEFEPVLGGLALFRNVVEIECFKLLAVGVIEIDTCDVL